MRKNGQPIWQLFPKGGHSATQTELKLLRTETTKLRVNDSRKASSLFPNRGN